MDEQTGSIQKLAPELIEQLGHVHQVPDDLLRELELRLGKELGSGNAAVPMTGMGELSQFRQDKARQRMKKKLKSRAARKRDRRTR